MKKKMIWFLRKLNGRKTTSMAILGGLIILALGEGWIDKYTADFFGTVLVALGLTANVANYKMQ